MNEHRFPLSSIGRGQCPPFLRSGLVYCRLVRWFAVVCCIALNAANVYGQASPAQPNSETSNTSASPSKPRFQRVFVPEDQVGKLVPRDYMPIAVNDLQSLLDKFESGEGVEWESQPKLARSLYTARLQGEQLLSELNYWDIDYQDDVAGYLPIKPWNLAITNPSNNPIRDSLTWGEPAQWNVDANGMLWLPIQDSTPLWFGWKGTTNESSNHSKSFTIQMPAATRNQMLLLLPKELEVRCAEAVVREIRRESLSSELDGLENPAIYDSLQNWCMRHEAETPAMWLLDFNGGTKLTLTFQAKLANPFENRQALVGSMLQQYRMNENGIDLLTRITFLNPIDSPELFFETDQNLKIREIKLGDQTLLWNTVVGDSSKIRVDLKGLTDTSRLAQFQITSFISQDHWKSSLLPCIKFSNSIVLKGDTVLECRLPVVPTSVTASGCEAISTNEAGTAGDTDLGRWQWRWSGDPPQISLSTSSMRRNVDASSLTRLNVIKGSLNATSWVRLSPQIKSGGETRFKLGEGWILDSLTTEPGSVLKINDTVLPDGTEILLRWENYTNLEQLTFELQAHRAIETDALDVNLPEFKFLDLKDGQLTGMVAVETTGRYLVKPNPTMLTMLSDEQQLSAWQQSKLPRFSNSWLLQGQEGRLPALSFTSEPSTFTGKWDVFVQPETDGISEEYRLQFRPLFGAMDRVLVRLRNSGPDELLWQWDDGGKPYLLQAVREVNESGSESYTIILPRPVNEPFAITAKRTVAANQWLGVPLPTSDQATSEELVLHISKLLNTRLPETGWISVLDTEATSKSDFAMYRAESSLADTISVARQDLTAIKKAWARQGEHEIRCFSDGKRHHKNRWNISNGRGESLQITIPSGSQWMDVRFDDAAIAYSIDPKNRELAVITLPSTSDSGELTIEFLEEGSPLRFRNQIDIRRATIDCGVVDTTETLLTPSLFTLVREGDLATLHGSNPVRQLTGILHAAMFGQSDQTSIFAQPTWASTPDEGEQTNLSIDRIVQWNRFQLSAPQGDTDLSSIVLWDTRFLRSIILMFGLAVGVLAIWGWVRIPKMMLGFALILFAISTSFSGLASLVAIYALAMSAIAWLVALTRISARVFTTKTQYSVSVRSHNTITRKAIPCLLFPLLWLSQGNSTLNAQEPAAGTYGILIPFTPEGEVKGNYVYVPIEAYQFLTNPSGQTYAPRTPYMIRQVSYQFRATEGVTMMDATSYQLIADYEIEVIDPSVAVRWPIGSGRAALERLVVNQFEIIPGFTVRQDELAIQWFPDRSGIFKLRLQLKPIPTSLELDQFDVPIPQVPTGTLALLTPSSKRVKVNGSTIDTTNGIPGVYQIGEQNRLSISVMDRDEVLDEQEPLDSDIDTWLHFQGDSAFLLTQIRMRYGDATIPKKVTLEMGDEWTPIGLNWGDGKWDGLVRPSPNGKNSYELNVQSTSMTEAILYAAWKPKGNWISEAVEPDLFPDSAVVNPIQFSLTTSHSPDSTWSLEVADDWTEETSERALNRWDTRGLGVTGQAYVSNSRASTPSIRRREVVSQMPIDETCDTIARASQFDLQYEANWTSETSGTELLLFSVPAGIRIQSLTINGTSRSDFRLVQSQSQTLLSLTNPNAVGSESYKLTCQATVPLKLGESLNIPRITATFGALESSFYRLHRETNLVMRLEDVEQLPDTRQMLERSTEDLLKSNQVGVLQVELAEHFLASSQLPVRLTVSQPNSDIDGSTLGLLLANNDRWRFTLITKLRSQNAPLDSLVFELPATITSQMEINPPCPFRLDPSPDGSHQLLSLFPAEPITEEQVHTISFDLNRISGQVSLPPVTLVGSGTLVHRVGLPQLSGHHNYTWRTTGLRPEPIPADFEQIINSIQGTQDISFQFLEPTSRRYQADLQSDKSNSPKMSVRLVRHRIELDNNRRALIRSTYWIDPEGFLTARFAIPDEMELYGALENGQPQAIQRDPITGIHSVAIQPSNLPTKLELILKSKSPNSWMELYLQLPTSINLEIEKSLVEFRQNVEGQPQLNEALFLLDGELATTVSGEDSLDTEVAAILNLLNDAEPTLAGYDAGTLANWNEAWREELLVHREALANNEEATRWLDRLGVTNLPENKSENSATTAGQLQSIALIKNGNISNVQTQQERRPIQIHLSNLLAIGLLVVGILWLAISGSKITKLFDRLSQVPALPLSISGFLVAIFTDYLSVGLAIAGLAAVSMFIQIYKHHTLRRITAAAPTASKRKIAT